MNVWKLRAETELVGKIEATAADQPWTSGSWQPTPTFERFAPLFEHELACLNAMNEQSQEWERAYQAIEEAGLSLQSPGGEIVAEWLLHIDGNEAWFRWSLESFD
ncbi:MAG: hypothetical protein ACRBK7_10765 [Acidimicrobiales bacterium]